MDFCYDLICFISIHASEEDQVIIPFIEHVSAQEEFGCKIFQGLLICNGRVLLFLKLPLDVVEPRFIIRFFLSC